MSNKNAKYRYFLVEIFVSVKVPDGMTREDFENWHNENLKLEVRPTEEDLTVSNYRNVRWNDKIMKNKIPGANLEAKE